MPNELSQTTDLQASSEGCAAPTVYAGLPGYELREVIGRGGMGEVYRARDTSLNRDVAIKLIQIKYAPGSMAVRRFLDEARITGQLQHPGIPPVHEVGELPDGRPYLVMKLIKGRTLTEMLAEGTTSRGSLIAAFEQICQAVAYAHNHGVIHRDLKPQNVMIGAFGEVQVMDWGLAKYRSDGRAETVEATIASTFSDPRGEADTDLRTRTGSFLGTPSYMAPEQAIGAVDQVDERSDVFGLGAVLCTILTGKPPFVANTSEATRQLSAGGKLEDAFARLDTSGAEPELIALCKRCLAGEREERPRNAGEVASAVHAIRSEAEARARQAELERVRTEGERAKAELQVVEQRRRRKVQLALAASVALLAASGGAFAWWQDRQAGERRTTEARLAGERDSEERFKVEQAQQGVRTNRLLADDLRKKYRFKEADAVLVQAAVLAKSGAPEMLTEVEQARNDLAFVVQLDDIRFRKWMHVAGQDGNRNFFNTKIASPEYRKAFADRGLNLETLDPAEAVKAIASSAAKADLVAAIDDWALYEADIALRDRLLDIARQADPGEWLGRLRDPAIRNNTNAIRKLVADAAPANLSSATLSTLAMSMLRRGLDPAPLLSAARGQHPTDFELAFVLGEWFCQKTHDGQEIGSLEAARALRPENLSVWTNLGCALLRKGDVDGAVAAYLGAVLISPTNALAHSNLGVALLHNGEIDKAIAAHQKAILLNPKLAMSHSNLGAALATKGDVGLAIAAYREAIELDPKLAEAHSGLGAEFAKNDEADKAIAAHQQAIKLDPNRALSHANLGVALLEKGDAKGAIAAHREAITLDPKLAKIHSSLGVALYKNGDIDDAIASCKEAIRLDPKYAQAYTNLSAALKSNGDVEGALAALKEAIRLDPKSSGAYYNLGAVLYDRGELDDAIAAYKEAIKLDPKRVNAHLNLAIALDKKGDVMGTIAAYEEIIRLDPKRASAHNSLGVALASKGDVDGAIAAYKEAIKLDASLANAHGGLGIELKKKGEVDGAIASYKEAIKLDPKTPAIHNNLGIALRDKGDVDGAIAAYKEAIRLDPKFAAIHNNLGVALKLKGDLDGAIAAYKEAIKIEPKLPALHYNLGGVLEKKRDTAGAIAAYREAIKFDPNYTLACNNLSWALATCPDEKHRDGVQAVKLATHACELTGWKHPSIIATLAAAHAEAGNYDKAIEFQKRVLTFPEYEKTSGSDARRRLDLYNENKPYRDPALAAKKKPMKSPRHARRNPDAFVLS